MIRRLLILSFILLPLFATGQTTFTSLNGPYIGNVSDLVKTSTGVFIAATTNSIYRSADGANWTRTPAGTSTNIQDLEINTTSGLIYATSFQLIFTSSDQGLSWTQLTTTGLPASSIKKIKIAPNGNVWIATGVTLYRANAATPTAFNLVSSFSSNINDLDFGPSNQVYVSTSNHGVKVSKNNGVSFSPTTTTLPSGTTYSLTVNPSGTLFVLTDGGPYRSTDEGSTWTLIKDNLTDSFFFGFIETDISGNVFLFNNSTRKVFSVSSVGSAATPVVWSAGKDYPISVEANAAVLSTSSNWLVGFNNYAIANTADAGTSWTQTSTGIKAISGGFQSPRLFRTATNRLFMGWSGVGYYVSIDDGATWDLLNTGDLNRSIFGFITASDNSIIGYGNGIVRSADNGQNWTLQSASNFHSFLTNIGSTLYSNSSTTTLLTSVNNGVTWTSLTMTGLTGTPQKLIASGSSLYTFTSTAGAGVYRINPTTGAATLVFSPPSGNIRDFQVVGNTILALGSSTILYVSSDNGVNWTNKTITASSRLWAFDDQNFFMTPNTPGIFFNTIDGGNTWATTSLGDATGFVSDALFTPQGVAYLMGTNMVVNKSSNVVVGPKAPTNLISLGKTVGGNFIQWNDNSTVETGYELEESTGGTNTAYQLTGTLAAVSNVQNKSYVQLGVIDPLVPEFVRLRAVNAAGASAYTNEISVTSMNVSCVRPATDLIPDNRSWTATTTVDPGFTAIFGCTANVCPSDLGGPYSYSTVVTQVGPGGSIPGAPLTGTGSMTEQTEGVYAMTDFSFGVYGAVYGDSPALGTLRFKDACNCVSFTGSDQYGDVFSITTVSVTSSKVLTITWTSTYGDKATTTLTRTDAKTWPALTSPSGTGPAVDTQINILKNSATNYTVSSYGGGLTITGRPAPTGSANFVESCGETLFLGSNSDIPNGNGTWNPATKTLTLKWQSNVNNIAFKGTTSYVLNPTDPVPGAPSLRAYIYSNTEAFLNWSASTFASSYDIERSTTSGSGFSVVATVNFPAVSYVDKNLTSGTQYFYRIKAKNSSGSSPASSEAAVTAGNSLFRPVENAISLNFENQQGVSWGDLDGDGDEDLALPSFTNNSGQTVPPVFYENLGNGQFNRRDLSALADENTGVSRGIALFDVDNDNDLDMFISRSGNLTCLLLVNNGNWGFTKKIITESAYEAGTGFRALGIFDYDKDGKADVFLGNDQGGGTPFTYTNYALKNDNGSSFSKTLAGAFGTDLNATVTLVSADYDNDGDQDIFAVNRAITAASPNRLYKNNGDGTFTQVTGLVFDTDLMTVARTASWGDINNDGNLDLYVGITQTTQPDRLYLNSGPPNYTFTSQTASVVAEVGSSTYGSAFGDIDNDGDLDLIVVNSGANSIFINGGTGTFTKSSTQELLVNPTIFEIGGSFSDFDKDGFLDFYPAKGSTGLVDLPNLLYKNTLSASSARNWIQVKLIGTLSNASALGARVKVVTISPNRTQIREVTALTGYGSQNSLVQHFGLGTATTVSAIEIRWPSGLTQTLNNITANQIITVTEDAVGPTITLSPAHNATNVSSSTSIQLTVNESSTRVAGKMLKIYRTSDLVNPVHSIDVSSATVAGNTFTFVLPQKLQLNTSYSASVDAGMFLDIWLNPSLEISTSNWQFTTSPGPQVTLLNPAHQASNVANNAKIELTFDIPVTGVSGKKIKVVDEANTSSIFLDVDASTGTVSGNKITFTPPAVFPYLKTLLVIIDPGAFVDASQNDFPGISSGNWKFTVVEAPDLTPPGVSFTAPSTLNKGFSSTKFEVTATDNKSITSAIMFYRKVTATNFSQLVGVLNATTSKYDFSVEETFFDDTGMEYYFEVKDPTENKTRSPVTGNHLTRLKYSDSNVGIGVTAGSTLSGYQIIAVPFEEMVSQQISVLFEEFGSPDATKWRMLRYKNSPQAWEEYPNPLSTVERGIGYFVISKSGVTLKLGEVSAPSNTQSNLFSLALKAGWNLIGNPYTSVINWSDSKVTGVGDLKIFSGGAYTNGDQLNVFQGGFVFADAATNVSVKLKTSPNGGRVSGSDLSADLGNSNWILPIQLEQMGERFLLGGVGMSEAARIAYDDLDDLAPPSLTSKLEMRFEHPEHFMKYFARDVVPTQAEYVWSFKVEAEQSGLADLKWDNASLGNNSRELFLMDETRQVVIDMREQNQYTFDPQISRKFKVYYGENLKEKVKPDGIFLGNAFPNPSNKLVNIPFTVSGSDNYQVRLDVYDMMGRRVTTLVDKELKSGYYSTIWDVEQSGSVNGLYTYRLLVTINGKSEMYTSKVIINK